MKKYLTIEGQKKILDELEYLTGAKRIELAKELKYATSLGDLRENSEYDSVCEDFKRTENRIYELEKQLKYSTIYKRSNNGTVEIGSTVTIEVEGELEEYKIVGFNESNIMENKISYESPLAQALLGKRVGESATVESEIGNYDCLIINIK